MTWVGWVWANNVHVLWRTCSVVGWGGGGVLITFLAYVWCRRAFGLQDESWILHSHLFCVVCAQRSLYPTFFFCVYAAGCLWQTLHQFIFRRWAGEALLEKLGLEARSAQE